MNLYAVVITHQDPADGQVAVHVSHTIARSEAEALGEAHLWADEHMAAMKGHHRQVAVVLIPKESVDAVSSANET